MRRSAAGVAATVLVLVLAGACGRPAPEDAGDTGGDQAAGPSLDAGTVSEGASGTATGVTEPGRAGVRVVSDSAILTPRPPTSPPTTAAPQGQNYEVMPGDTLSVIAERFGITTAALAGANGIDDVNTIKPGQELIIPPPTP